MLARAQPDAVWSRQQLGTKVRAPLKDFYPAAIEAFAGLAQGGLARRDARTVLAAAPSPAVSARLTRAQSRASLVKAGRERNIDTDVDRLHTILRAEYPHQPAIVENAMGIQLAAPPRQFEAARVAADDLAEAARTPF